MRTRGLCVFVCVFLAMACGDSSPPAGGDGGRRDTGARGDDDAGPPFDAGRLPDAGLPAPPTYELRIFHPRAVGTAPEAGGPAIEQTHRSFWAYPGIEYNIRAVVGGGVYPYRFALANAPAGMTIDERTGVIVWPAPAANASDITLTVTDAEGESVQTTWSIAVDASHFLFIDSAGGTNAADNGCTAACGTGTIENPWRTISDMYQGLEEADAYAGRIVYFRAGTYDALDCPRERVGGAWEQVVFHTAFKPVAWLEYPGEQATLDFGFDGAAETGPLIRFIGPSAYVDGLETIRSHYIGFQLEPSAHYAVFRRMDMHAHGPGEDGSNASFIMTMTGADSPTYYMSIQDNELYDFTVTTAIKIYSTVSLVIEDNTFHHGSNPIELKADVREFLVQGNVLHDIEGIALGGNMHDTTTNGEFRFNLVRSATFDALRLNQDGMAQLIRVYRNTFMSRVRISNTDSADGPFELQDNVIVDPTPEGDCVDGSIVYCEDVSDATRIVIAPPPDEDLECTPDEGCVDANGNLQGTFREMYLGVKGHEIP